GVRRADLTAKRVAPLLFQLLLELLHGLVERLGGASLPLPVLGLAQRLDSTLGLPRRVGHGVRPGWRRLRRVRLEQVLVDWGGPVIDNQGPAMVAIKIVDV